MIAEKLAFVALYLGFAAGYAMARKSPIHHWLAPGSFILLLVLFIWVAGRVTLFPESAHKPVGLRFDLQLAHDLSGGLSIITGIVQCITGPMKSNPSLRDRIRPVHWLSGHLTFGFMTLSFLFTLIVDVVTPVSHGS